MRSSAWVSPQWRERPGDLLELIESWKTEGRLGTLSEMIERGIERKLAEFNRHRYDNHLLTPERARRGAETVAAELTLGKSLALRTPDAEPNPDLLAEALDPLAVLHDWTDAERNALIRRGIFPPATYGRVRLHHRSTQEYLTACWIRRRLDEGCPLREAFDLLFADVGGIELVIPSMRSVRAPRHDQPFCHQRAGQLPRRSSARARTRLAHRAEDAVGDRLERRHRLAYGCHSRWVPL